MTLSPSTEQREAGSPHPARRRLGRRLSATHVVIAVVVLLAFVLNLLVLQDRSSTMLVAVSDRALATGSALDRSSLRLVPVESDFEGLPGLVTEDDLGSLDGWVLSRPIPAGGLLDQAALVRPGSGSGLRSMSLPVPVEHAAGGSLVAGDRVDVIAVTDGVADFVAVDLEVTSVSEAASGAIGTVSSYHVVVNVESDEALRLAEALAAGPVEILRATGAIESKRQMVTPDIAMAASARNWPERLHRFILDHGGGRIVNRVMSAEQATGTKFDVLLVDDVCSFLSPRLVSLVKQSGSEVIGVYMPEDGSDAKRRLLECGISDVIETEASPEEFLSKVRATLSHRTPLAPLESPADSSAFRIGVTGACEGVGITEISIALSRSISMSVDTVLVDLDPVWPSVAQRLDLPLHPNIRTAIDHALHRPDRLIEALQPLERLSVVGGRADGGQGAEISRVDALMLLDSLGSSAELLVVDLGPMTEFSSALIREFDTVMLVGTGTPVGVARLIRTAGVVRGRHPSASLVAVANKTVRGGFHRSEVVAEIGRALPDVPVVTLPVDPRLEEAAWNGTLSGKGRFNRAVDDISRLFIRSLN